MLIALKQSQKEREREGKREIKKGYRCQAVTGHIQSTKEREEEERAKREHEVRRDAMLCPQEGVVQPCSSASKFLTCLIQIRGLCTTNKLHHFGAGAYSILKAWRHDHWGLM